MILILILESIFLYKKLKVNKSKYIIFTVILTILIAISIIILSGYINKKQESENLNDAYYECIDFAKETKTSLDYCDIYK